MEKKLNICLLNDSFPPAIDGVANVVVNYATEFSKKGLEVCVATPKYPGIKDDYEFDVLQYPSINTIDSIGYVTGMPFSAKYVSKFVDKEIDIIHTHCPMTSCFLSRILRDDINKPIIMTYHTKYDIDVKRTIKSKLLQKISINAIVENISACDEVWAVSKGAAENLKSLGYKGEVIVMENGVDMPKGRSNKEDTEAIKKEYGLKDGVPTYLFVGRMMWYKGIKIILDGLKMLDEKGKDYQMLFVGSGIEFEEIKKYCDDLKLDKVIFAGPVRDRKKLKDIFSACDLFLFPSTFDTNGLVVREAASSGLGAMLIEGSCAAEGTTNYRNAIWIQENAESLAQALMSIKDEQYREIGDNAMNELYISWQEASSRAYSRYQEVLKNYQPKKTRFKLNDALFKVIGDTSLLLHHIDELEEGITLSRSEDFTKAKSEIEELKNKIKHEHEKLLDRLKNNIMD